MKKGSPVSLQKLDKSANCFSSGKYPCSSASIRRKNSSRAKIEVSDWHDLL